MVGSDPQLLHWRCVVFQPPQPPGAQPGVAPADGGGQRGPQYGSGYPPQAAGMMGARHQGQYRPQQGAYPPQGQQAYPPQQVS